MHFSLKALLAFALAAFGTAPLLQASSISLGSTILRFDTSLGNIDVRLFQTATPLSKANFMNYVNDDDFDGSFFHRAPKTATGTFVVQGGGFNLAGGSATAIPTDAPVQNEPGISNLKYTLAYAKLGGDPNSATSGFFFNMEDNSSNLDNQNGGFTVFGRIVAGFDVIDAIADLDIADLDGAGSTFNTVPVQGTTGTLNDILVFVNDVNELDLPDGDYNFDGLVNGQDLTIWQTTLGSTTDLRADGNGNGVVDTADYAPLAAIPEPASASLLLLLTGAAAVVIRSKKQS